MADSSVNPLPLVATATISATSGDQIANSVADILSWSIQIHCNCIVPTNVVGAIHTLCLFLIVIGACLLHVEIFKKPT